MNVKTTLDVRSVPPPQRHPLIFQTFEGLQPGEAFILVNDHDPRPLYYQFKFEREGGFVWDYLEQGPEVWRVRIGKSGGDPVS
ncbi:MAG: hemerythrin [Chloroflexota bacterium]